MARRILTCLFFAILTAVFGCSKEAASPGKVGKDGAAKPQTDDARALVAQAINEVNRVATIAIPDRGQPGRTIFHGIVLTRGNQPITY
jgi:hypothetical protein